ncbi:MAG: integration host factor, actinobacterial type [Propionibacteriaceae bacterium]
MTVPALTNDQLRAARQAATEARRRRAELKERLRRSELTLPEALDLAAADDTLAHAKVVDVLKSVPRVGEKRASDTMTRLDIAPNRRLRGLGKHQVAALREEFGRRVGPADGTTTMGHELA